ncbi:MAG TPA: peroxiredoxin [Armatimonadota bacterium]|jgi:peroxiredoxin Q/BCP
MHLHLLGRAPYSLLIGLACLSVGAAGAATKDAPKAPAMPAIGKKAPDFTLQADDGKTYKLSKQKGSWVALTFYPKDNTPGCTAEACSLRDEMGDLKGLGVRVFGISLDGIESHKSFAEQQKLNYPLLADPDKKVTQRYGVLHESGNFAKRVTFIIDPKGVLRKIDDGVKTGTHGKDLVAEVKELKEEKKPAA